MFLGVGDVVLRRMPDEEAMGLQEYVHCLEYPTYELALPTWPSLPSLRRKTKAAGLLHFKETRKLRRGVAVDNDGIAFIVPPERARI